MELFREKIKVQNLAIAMCCLILSVFSFLAAAGEAGIIGFMVPAAENSHWQSMWRGIVMGMTVGIMIVLIAFLIRNILALKDDKRLKKLYVETNDEREIQIWTAARARAMQTFMILGLVAGIIAGYFSMVVCITIIACTFLQAITGLFFALYYSYKT